MIKNLVILLCVILIVVSLNRNLKAETDPYPNIEIPVISNGYNIKKFFSKPKGTKSVNYFVKIEYPSKEVLKFYDTRLKKMGWIPHLRDNIGEREWECFIDGTIKGDPRVRQLLALWIFPERKVEAFLALRYVKFERNWGNELEVHCQIQPLIDTTKLDEFFKKMEKSKQYAEFMKLLDLYRIPNREVDIDKAISENPDNNYLKEYKRITDEMNQELERVIDKDR